MRKILVVSSALAAILACGALAPTSAFATEWLFNGEPVIALLPVDSVATELLFTDMKGNPLGGEITLHCSFLEKGFVGPNGEDEITEITKLEAVSGEAETDVLCESLSSICSEPLSEAIHLPWLTQLILVGSEIRDELTANGAGNPGYIFTCKTVIGSISDECSFAKMTTGMSNGIFEGMEGVNATFEGAAGGSAPWTCTIGGANEGLTDGVIFTWHLEGVLSVS